MKGVKVFAALLFRESSAVVNELMKHAFITGDFDGLPSYNHINDENKTTAFDGQPATIGREITIDFGASMEI